MEIAKARGNWLGPHDAEMPLGKWTEEFMRLCRRLAPSTQDTYRRDLDRYVLPRFKQCRIGFLPADEIENWLNDEIDAGIAPSSVHRHYRTPRRVLQVAVEKQKILQNPCSRVAPPKVPHREMVFLDWPQVVDLAEALTERFRALIYLAVDSGMRWSELIGLRRSRVDVERRKVQVTEQIVRRQSGEWIRKEPKTPSSVRSISISSFTAELLTAHMKDFAGAGTDGLVFPNRAGNPISSASFWNNHFAPALREAGIRCRFHDLRHTSVALAIAEGSHPKAIQTRMGHSSINVTLDRYGHLFPGLDEAIASSFDNRLAEARRKRDERTARNAKVERLRPAG
jgi:integrase